MDWSLLGTGVFAAAAVLLLLDAVRRPERWHVTGVRRWLRVGLWVVVATSAAMLGAGLAGASGSTLGFIAVVGVVIYLLTANITGVAWLNRAIDRWRR